MRLAKDLLESNSDLLRLLARTNDFKSKRRDLERIPRLAIHLWHLYNYALEMAPDHASGEGPAGGTSDLLRLLARTNRLELNREDLVRIQWLMVNCSQLCTYALEMAPDHVSGIETVGG